MTFLVQYHWGYPGLSGRVVLRAILLRVEGKIHGHRGGGKVGKWKVGGGKMGIGMEGREIQRQEMVPLVTQSPSMRRFPP